MQRHPHHKPLQDGWMVPISPTVPPPPLQRGGGWKRRCLTGKTLGFRQAGQQLRLFVVDFHLRGLLACSSGDKRPNSGHEQSFASRSDILRLLACAFLPSCIHLHLSWHTLTHIRSCVPNHIIFLPNFLLFSFPLPFFLTSLPPLMSSILPSFFPSCLRSYLLFSASHWDLKKELKDTAAEAHEGAAVFLLISVTKMRKEPRWRKRFRAGMNLINFLFNLEY